ncbi:hypothetical protein [Robertkochia sediminum]|uniref:hypothetical protein n=1 Tax=Robertkochia sediminum TaxID=2785326 RepID=UPI00193219A8|nr:hypothetical protein [Robertkochia sediminum]MBL7471363.1 hypothetical protein [Robertkochia sediminum]
MEVIIFQLGVFAAIFIGALFGRGGRNLAIIALSIFTIVMVFTTWLMILQFITIYMAYEFTEGILDRMETTASDNQNHTFKENNQKSHQQPNPYPGYENSSFVKGRAVTRKSVERILEEANRSKAVDDVVKNFPDLLAGALNNSVYDKNENPNLKTKSTFNTKRKNPNELAIKHIRKLYKNDPEKGEEIIRNRYGKVNF